MSTGIDQQQRREFDGAAFQDKKMPSKKLAFEIHRICLLSQQGMYEEWLHDHLLARPLVNRNSESVE